MSRKVLVVAAALSMLAVNDVAAPATSEPTPASADERMQGQLAEGNTDGAAAILEHAGSLLADASAAPLLSAQRSLENEDLGSARGYIASAMLQAK